MRQTQALALLKRSAKRRGDRAIAHLSCIVPSPENAGRTEGLDGGGIIGLVGAMGGGSMKISGMANSFISTGEDLKYRQARENKTTEHIVAARDI